MSRFILGCDEGVHKFEPRYDYKLPDGLKLEKFDIGVLDACRSKTYIHDICIKCGKTVKEAK